MQQQVISMKEEWKKEQELVVELERENRAKHEELANSLRVNSGLKNMIEALKSDITCFKNQIDSAAIKKTQSKSKAKEEAITIGLSKIEELDALLLERTEQLEDCKERLESARSDNAKLIEENDLITNELCEA